MADIVLKNIYKRFGDFTAVKNLDLEIRDKEFLVLLGPSGCGKTTTLRMISGLELPSEGQILLDNEDVTQFRASKRDIAFVFQLFALYPHLSVYNNIAFPLKTQGVGKAQIEIEVQKIAKLLHIDNIMNKKPKQRSEHRSVYPVTSGFRKNMTQAIACTKLQPLTQAVHAKDKQRQATQHSEPR